MLKFAPFVLANLGRRRARTGFTLASVAIAFVLFGLLAAVRQGFEAGVELAGADRLITIHKVSLVQPLPLSYQQRIASTAGVSLVASSTWFGARYQDERSPLVMSPVEPESYLAMYPEYVLGTGERERWIRNRTGMVAGRTIANRYGWKVGDRIPIRSDIYAKADGSYTWELVLDGIFDNREPSGDTNNLFFHYDYFDEARANGKGTVGWYIVRVRNPAQAAQVARDIDAQFANSPAETRTATEKAFIQGFARQAGDIGTIVLSIGAAVFFTMLLVSGNTMAQSVRERTKEIAVLKTLGFSDGRILLLVLGESLLMTMLGGVSGLFVAAIVVNKTGNVLSEYLSSFILTPAALAVGVVLMIVLGIVSGALPAVRASRLRIADALTRNQRLQ